MHRNINTEVVLDFLTVTQSRCGDAYSETDLRGKSTKAVSFPAFITLSLLALFFIHLFAVTGKAHEQAKDILDWQVRGVGREVYANKPYGLMNTTLGKSLMYGYREYGINLCWSLPTSRPNFVFKPKSDPDSKERIKHGEKFAIYVEGGGYLNYESRRWGINLDYSDHPSYEWEIRGGMNGDLVEAWTDIALFNHVEKDYMVYCPRDWGINLRWWKDTELSKVPADETTTTIYLEPHLVPQGIVPYTARFPLLGSSMGTLKKIEIPHQDRNGNLVVAFVRSGYTTAQCLIPNAVVLLGEGDTMPEHDMKALFGTFTPSLPVEFVACVSRPVVSGIYPVAINITYTK